MPIRVDPQPWMLLQVMQGEADLVLEAFDREMDYLGCTVAGKYVVPQCTKPSELGDKGEKTARQMHADLLGVQ